MSKLQEQDVQLHIWRPASQSHPRSRLHVLPQRPDPGFHPEVAGMLQECLINFVIRGDPNGCGLPKWLEVQATGVSSLVYS